MPSSHPVQRLTDMVETIDRIVRYTAGMDLQAFVANGQTVLAVKYSRSSSARLPLNWPPWPRCSVPGFPGEISAASATFLLIERSLPPLRNVCVNALRALGTGDPTVLCRRYTKVVDISENRLLTLNSNGEIFARVTVASHSSP